MRALTQHGFALILQFKAECLQLLFRLLFERLDALPMSLSERLQLRMVMVAETLLQILTERSGKRKASEIGRGKKLERD